MAALSGALGAALLSMVCNLTLGKRRYADVQDDIAALVEKTEELRHRLTDLLEEDVEVFTGVSAANIEALASIYGDRNRGTVSLWCMGVNQHTRGTWMNNLINDIHLVTGKISRPG